MPGICAMASKNVVAKDLFSSMIESLRHEDFQLVDRYYSEHFAGARIHLGIFNPLAQPLFNRDRSICVMLDGKIYGHSEKADLEYCLESYEECGNDFIRKLNGNFVLLIHDFRDNKTLVANDRFGFRVHYYALHNGSLTIAPEPKAILQDSTFKKEIDDEGLIGFLSFGDFFSGKTLFKGIHVIEPASILTFDGDVLSVDKYWRYSYNPDYSKTDKEFVEELVKRFEHAVRIRIKDPLRYSVALSGGLDSRMVLSTLTTETSSEVGAVTWGKPECDEAKIAKRVTKELRVKNHRIIDIAPELVLQYAGKEVFLTDGHSYIGQGYAYPVMKEVRKSTDVLLDGFALDLTLGGSYLTPNIVHYEGRDFLNLLLNCKPYVRYFYAQNGLKLLLTAEYFSKVKDIPYNLSKAAYEKLQSKEYGNKFDEFAINVHMIYAQVGDITVRNFVEVTHPTADNDFIDLLLTIPPEKRLHHRVYRKFLKKIAPGMAKITYNKTMVRPDMPIFLWNVFSKYNTGRAILSNKIRKYTKGKLYSQEKKSYVNFFQWFQTNENWQKFFNEVLVENPPKNALFNNGYVHDLLKEQIRGQKNNVGKLLYITTIYLFLRDIFAKG